MKKLLAFSMIFASALYFSQGKLFLQNYSNYNLAIRVVGGSTTNCLPEAVASMNFPANTQDVIDNYNDSAPYTLNWSVRTSTTGSPLPQTVPASGLLTAISPITRWQFLWYQAVDPATNQPVYDNVTFNMGDPSAFPNCTWGGSTHVDGNYTEAFWFYLPSENATYLIVQP